MSVSATRCPVVPDTLAAVPHSNLPRLLGRTLGVAVLLAAVACIPTGPAADFARLPGSALVFDLECGPEDYNRFDILIPDADQPTPLLIYVHGGSFWSGDKDDVYESFLTLPLIEAGVAVASINYATLNLPDNDGVITSLNDIARCVQSIRESGESFNVDDDRVAYAGDSAGGGAALWLGLGDDHADPDSSDPVARQSTVPVAIAGFEAQSSYDIDRWIDDLFAEFDLTEAYAWENYPVRPLYNITTLDELHSAESVEYRSKIDMLREVDAADPPMYVSSALAAPGFPWTPLAMYHHPNHVRSLKAAGDAVGVEVVAEAPLVGLTAAGGETAVEFLLRQLQVPPAG